MREARAKSDPDDDQAQVTLARALDIVSGWRLWFDDLPGARRDAERAIAIVEPLTGEEHRCGPASDPRSAPRRTRAEALGRPTERP